MLKITSFILKSHLKRGLCSALSAIKKNSDKSGLSDDIKLAKDDLNFDLTIDKRRAQAKRTLLINLSTSASRRIGKEIGENSIKNYLFQLNDYLVRRLNCKINHISHFQNTQNSKDYALIEFKNEDDVNYIIKNQSGHFQSCNIGMQTRCLIVHANALDRVDNRYNASSSANLEIIMNQDLSIEKESLETLESKLNESKSLDEQILYLCNSNKINDFSLRLKFFVASLIEDAINITYPKSSCLPFGSTLNGFGCVDSDLDLSIRKSSAFSDEKNKQGLFYFETKTSDKPMNLQELHYNLTNYLPHFRDIYHISSARVPILKGEFYVTNPSLEFDISTQLTNSYLMTRILWSYAAINSTVVKPLVKLVKFWTQITELSYKMNSNSIPVNLSSFHAIILTLSFLVQKNLVPELTSIIPNANEALKSIRSNRKTSYNELTNEEEIYSSYKFSNAQDILALRLKYSGDRKSRQNLFNLFLEFLEFYANFNYKNKISLLKTCDVNHTKTNQLFIANPLDPSINASPSIRYQQFHRFQYALKESVSIYKNTGPQNLVKILRQVKVPRKVSDSIDDIELPSEIDLNATGDNIYRTDKFF